MSDRDTGFYSVNSRERRQRSKHFFPVTIGSSILVTLRICSLRYTSKIVFRTVFYSFTIDIKLVVAIITTITLIRYRSRIIHFGLVSDSLSFDSLYVIQPKCKINSELNYNLYISVVTETLLSG